MACILVRIRASSPALRSLRPSGINRFFCQKDDDRVESLEKLLEQTKIQKPSSPIKLTSVKPPRKVVQKVPSIDAKTVRAAESAAESLPGDVQKNVDELLQQLKNVSEESRSSLEDVLLGIKINREARKPATGRNAMSMGRMVDNAFLDSIHFPHDEEMQLERSKAAKTDQHKITKDFNLFNGPRLNIFSGKEKNPTEDNQCSMPYWDQLEERELRFSCKVPPKNGFEELIQWTEEGKLWQFPIDNEFGMVEEANVKFEDHVFLDHLIQDDNAFPEGPLKNFMELVCVGLSKNPYISVARKHNVIEWYRQYFVEKKGLIEASVEN